MLLKNHLIEVFKKASSEKNFLLKENIVLKWVHRFGIDSLNDLLIHSSAPKENQHKQENQEQMSLIDEVNEKENQENQEQMSLIDEVNEKENQEIIRLELLKNSGNREETNWESTDLETSRSNEIIGKNLDSNKIKQYKNTQKSPLPYIKNLRKWINNDKKVS